MGLKDRVSDQDLVILNGKITDISSTSGSNTTYIPSPITGKVVKVMAAHNAALTTGGSDATITPKINGTAMTNGAITVAKTTSVGDVDSSEPTGNNHITAGEAIELESDGSSTTACESQISAVIQPDES